MDAYTLQFSRLPWARAGALALAAVAALCSLGATAQSAALQVDALVQPALRQTLLQQSRLLHTPVAAPTITLDADWSPYWQENTALQPGNATEIGVARSIPATQTVGDVQQWLQWQATDSGGHVAALSVHAPQARAVRLGLWVQQLPASASVRIYSPQQVHDVFTTSGQQIAQLLHAHRMAGERGADAHIWWTPEVPDAAITLEITLPPGMPTDSVQIALPQLMHIYSNPWLTPADVPDGTFWPQAIGDAEGCNLDASCYDAYATQGNAVARMSYVAHGRSYACTGTLVNDLAGSFTPYFLTANHCISRQSEASTLQTAWFFRSSSCSARSLSSQSQTLRGGATLLYTTVDPDTTLLRLNDHPPANAVFAGWDATPVPLEQSIVGMHHPAGDLQKISFGQVSTWLQCRPIQADGSFSCQSDSTASATYYGVRWSAGTTENGSSGSALFHGGRLSGVLSGGSGSCSSNSKTSVYGSFSTVFNALRPWLAGSANPTPPNANAARQPIFRFFNTTTGAHFYTPSSAERDTITSTLPSYRYEGIAFYAGATAAEGLQPVERFFNTVSQSHFYTIDAQERATVQSHLPQFRYEGQTWHASHSPAPGMRPVYRFYNAASSTHFYTATEAERDTVAVQLPSFHYEGIAYYVWETP